MSETAPGSKPPAARGRGRMLLVLKLATAVTLLGLLVASGRLELGRLRDIPRTGHTALLVLSGLAAVGVGMGLLALRLVIVLRLVGIQVSARRAGALTAAGLFCGTVLPGAVGGDLVKIAMLCRGEARSNRLATSAAIVYERMIGLFSLLLLGSLALAVAWAADALPFRSPVLLATPAAAVAMIALYAVEARWHLVFGRADRDGVGWLPRKLRDGLAVGTHFGEHRTSLVACIALSLVNHLLVCSTYFIGAALLRSPLTSMQQLLLNPVAMVINTIPVTPGGLGTTEGAFSYLYAAAGCTLGATVAIVGRLVQYTAYALSGLPALFSTRNR